MKRLHWINALGVLLLAVLCLLQWSENRSLKLQLEAGQAEKLRRGEILVRLETEKKALTEDLDSFRSQLGASSRSGTETKQKLRQIEDEKSRLADTLQDLRQQVKTWQTASSERDARIAAMNKNVTELSADRDKTTAQYRELLLRLEECQKLLQERTQLYNQMVEKLNAKP